MQIKFNEVTDSLLKYCPYIAIPVGCDIRHYSNKNFRFFGPRLRYLSISQQNFGLFRTFFAIWKISQSRTKKSKIWVAIMPSLRICWHKIYLKAKRPAFKANSDFTRQWCHILSWTRSSSACTKSNASS